MPFRRRGLALAAVSAVALLAAGVAGAQTVGYQRVPARAAAPQTLADAVGQAYQSNPILQQQRALLRASDENYVQARAGYRPSADASVQANYSRSGQDQSGIFGGGNGDYDNDSYGLSLNLVQPLYTGGRVSADVRATQSEILANREQVRNVEQQVVFQAINFYVDVLRDRAILGIRENNVAVLRRQLLETNARFEVGEITRTDVAQAQARLANAEALYAQSQAQLAISAANYREIVGETPGDLAPEPPLPGLPPTLQQAFAVAEAENPVIRVAQFQEQAAHARVAVARSAYRPSVSLSASVNNSGTFTESVVNTPVSAGLSLRGTIPLFTGGLNDSRVRQALENENAARINVETRRREIDQAVTQAWNQLLAARAQLISNQEQVRAATLAFQGVQEEQRVGLRTTLDVLNAEQELRNAELFLVQSRRDAYVAGAGVLQAMGRLQANDVTNGVPEYDPRANFETVARAGSVPWEGVIQTLDSIGAPRTTSPRRPPVPNPLPPEAALAPTEGASWQADPSSSGPIPTTPNIPAAQPFRSSADPDAPSRPVPVIAVDPGPLYRAPVGGPAPVTIDPNRRPGVIPRQPGEAAASSTPPASGSGLVIAPATGERPAVVSNAPVPNPGSRRR